MSRDLTAGPFALNGMVAVVTGSSTGIGRAIALQMAGAGAKVVVHGRQSSNELQQSQQDIATVGGFAKTEMCDVSLVDALADFVDRCWNAYGQVDCWVNNAGADILAPPNEAKLFAEKLDLLWRTDVAATVILSRLIGGKMRDQTSAHAGRCSILNMGWSQAWQGMEGESGELFATTKGAIMAATKSLAMTLAPAVRVNCLAPGWIQTDWGQAANESWQDRARRQSLMNRWGTPADIATTAVWLASPAASFVSGQIINIDGGFRSW